MINLASAELLFALIVLVVAYLISHTLNGCFQSYVISCLGDNTARDEGYMSLNPLDHIDLCGFLVLIFLGIGWMQTVPIDPYAFIGKWRYLRLFLAYFTEAVGALILTIVSLVLSVVFFGYYLTAVLVIQIFSYFSKSFMIFFSKSAHLNIAALFSDQHSTLAIVSALLLVCMVYINILVAAISIIFNGFRYALIVGFEKGYRYMEYAEYLSFLGPFLVVYLFGEHLVFRLLQITEWGACQLAHIFGV
jgi:hypothetical protein